MTNFDCVIGVIFFLYFVPYECVGDVHLPPGGSRMTLTPGSTAKIKWSFDVNVSKVDFRAWFFKNDEPRFRSKSSYGYTVAYIHDDGDPQIKYKKLPGVAIEKPATLVLKNISINYNGSYGFYIVAPGEPIDPTWVAVFIAVTPTVTINCSSPITVNEGDDVTCVCKGEGDYPLMWYTKDGGHISGRTKEEATLTLRNINKTDNGTYTCVAESHNLAKNETSIKIIVNYAPEELYFKEKALVGESFTIQCEANGRPEPRYTIVHNNTEVVTTEKTYTITVVNKTHAGLYKCNAKNKLGKSSKTYHLSVIDRLRIATTDTTTRNFLTTKNPKKADNKADDGGRTVVVWHIVISSGSGFIMGILTSCIVVCCCRLFSRRKHQSNPQPQATKDSSIYQELNVNKMNSEDNYQALRLNHEPENESVYMDLNQTTRDDENHYQTLTRA